MYILRYVFLGFLLQGSLFGQQNIRLMQYNLLNFGNDCGNVQILEKYAWLRSVLSHAKPDVLAVNELNPNILFTRGILSQSFNYSNAFAAATITNDANSQIVNQLFYNKDKVELVKETIIPYSLRDINAYRLYVKGSDENGGDSLFFYCVVAHFKATDDPTSANSRNIAAQLIMNWKAQRGDDDPVILMGDLNIYRSNESAYQTLINNSNSPLSFEDPISISGWGGAVGAGFYTQSTRTSSQDCGAGGGLDDRFDMMLMSEELLEDNQALHVVAGSYRAMGNDGNSYNQSLNCSGNNSVPFTVCANLVRTSDHLPVLVDLVAANVVSRSNRFEIPGLHMSLLQHPIQDMLRIELRNEDTQFRDLELSIHNLLGQEVYTQDLGTLGPQLRQVALPFTHLKAGMYVLRLQDHEGRFISRKIWKR